MKKIIILSVFSIILALPTIIKAQSNIENSINSKFIRWGSEWSVDSYVVGSARVINVDTDDPNEWFVTGTFSFTRFFTTYNIGFTAILKINSDNTYTIKKLCYDDSSAGMKDCKTY